MNLERIIEWHWKRAKDLAARGEMENCLFHTDIIVTIRELKAERDAFSDQLDNIIEG